MNTSMEIEHEQNTTVGEVENVTTKLQLPLRTMTEETDDVLEEFKKVSMIVQSVIKDTREYLLPETSDGNLAMEYMEDDTYEWARVEKVRLGKEIEVLEEVRRRIDDGPLRLLFGRPSTPVNAVECGHVKYQCDNVKYAITNDTSEMDGMRHLLCFNEDIRDNHKLLVDHLPFGMAYDLDDSLQRTVYSRLMNLEYELHDLVATAIDKTCLDGGNGTIYENVCRKMEETGRLGRRRMCSCSVATDILLKEFFPMCTHIENTEQRSLLIEIMWITLILILAFFRCGCARFIIILCE